MTDTTTFDTQLVPLGVGRIIGDTFSVLYRKLHIILVLAFIPALIELMLRGLITGISVGAEAVLEIYFQTLAVVLLSWTISSIVTAAIVLMSYNARLNRPVKLGRCIAATITVNQLGDGVFAWFDNCSCGANILDSARSMCLSTESRLG